MLGEDFSRIPFEKEQQFIGNIMTFLKETLSYNEGSTYW